MHKMDNMFFEYVFVEGKGETFDISSGSKVIAAPEGYAKAYAEQVIENLSTEGKAMEISLSIGITDMVRTAVGNKFCDHEESYALIINDKIEICAATQKGLKYGVSTLKQLIEAGQVREMILFDYPDKNVRGYRIYMPGIDYFDDFKRMLDMMIYYKYNSIIIEVGGAMEYRKHPEINRKWVKFCKEVRQSPHEYERIQKQTHPEWCKNSIHADNGNGGFLTQDQVRQVLSFCRERELTVIPEVPSLSHSDYIVMAHPELNERKEDTYPDTYCPSNPKSYEILFDILDEVIEVFEPEMINIGHDEIYTLAKCDKCKEKNPVDLYVGDIIKINNYLKNKNIRTLMWCEKMFGNCGLFDGWPVGGAANPEKDIPALYECKGKIPKDIWLLHWYWSICDLEEEALVQDMGYKMIFANFSAIDCKEYRKRSMQMDGGFVSNWGSVEEVYMQRNAQNYSLISTAFVFWNSEYDSDSAGILYEKVKNELYRRYLRSLGEHYIEILHTTDMQINHYSFYDGYYIVEEEWLLGHYLVSYEDGSSIKLPVLYGYNIDCCDREDTLEGLKRKEALGASIPVRFNGRTYYKTAYQNLYPDKTIKSISFQKEGTYEATSYELWYYAEQSRDNERNVNNQEKESALPEEIGNFI